MKLRTQVYTPLNQKYSDILKTQEKYKKIIFQPHINASQSVFNKVKTTKTHFLTNITYLVYAYGFNSITFT